MYENAVDSSGRVEHLDQSSAGDVTSSVGAATAGVSSGFQSPGVQSPGVQSPGVQSPGVQCAELVASLSALVGELTGLVMAGGLRELPDVAVAEVVVGLARVSEGVAAVNAAALSRVDSSGVVQGQGYVSTASWLREQTRVDVRSARDQIRTARLLTDSYPTTHQAWLSGVITGGHAGTLVRGVHAAMKAVDPKHRADARRESEAALLDIANEYSVDHTIAAVKRIRAAVDPDGMRASAMELDGREYFKLTPVVDGYVASGWFSFVNGTKLASVLEGRRNSMYHAGEHDDTHLTSAGDRDGVMRDDAGDRVYDDEVSARRMYAQNAIIMGQIADELLTGGYAGVMGGERPHVEIAITLADLTSTCGFGELTVIGATRPANTTPIHVDQVREHACDAHIRRVILTDSPLHPPGPPGPPDRGRIPDPGRTPDPGGTREPGKTRDAVVRRLLNAPSEIVDYGRVERIVPSGLRRVLARRDGGCVFPGCARPAHHTHAHHVHHWVDGGTSDLANLASLCSTHHHAIHDPTNHLHLIPTPGKQPNQPGYWTVESRRSGTDASRSGLVSPTSLGPL